jgi:hypothetical protein
MDRPDAVGHLRRQCSVSPPAQGRCSGFEGRGASRPGAGRTTGRSIRGYRAGDFVGGASEAAYLGRERSVRTLAVCDRAQQIDDFAEILAGEPAAETASASEVAAQLESLPARQREVLQSIAVESASIKDTAAKYSMSEGAVRVALHRGLASLTARLREQ